MSNRNPKDQYPMFREAGHTPNRRDSMDLDKATDLDLLRELVRRNKKQTAPALIELHSRHYSILVAVGADETADIIMAEEAMTALFAMANP